MTIEATVQPPAAPAYDVQLSSKKNRRASLFYFADKADYCLMFFGTIFAISGGATLPWHFNLVGTINQIVTDCVDRTAQNRLKIGDNRTDRTYQCMKDVVYVRYMWQFGGLLCLMFFGTFLQDIFWRLTATRQMRKLRCAFFQALLSQDQEWYVHMKVGQHYYFTLN